MAARAKTIAFSENPYLRLFALAAFAAAMLTAAVVLATSARAGSAFDGAWRVTIITQSGNCDPAYSYPVKVEGGRVSYSGDGSFDISGHVGDAGAVSVTIARGDQKASGSGKGGIKAKLDLTIAQSGEGSSVTLGIDLGGLPLIGPAGKAAAKAVEGDLSVSLENFGRYSLRSSDRMVAGRE